MLAKNLFIYTLILIVGLLSFLTKPTKVFASTIYSNSFNGTTLSNFTITGSCNDSQGYLTATSGTCDLNWNAVSNYGCVSLDIYNATGNTNINPLSIGTNFVGANNTDFVGGLNFGDSNIVYLFDNEIGGTIHPYPSGISESLSGWHHFDLCEDGSMYNLYYDSSLIISYTPSTYATWNGLNFQVGSENQLKNLIISDNNNSNFTLPVPLLKQTDPLWGSQIYDSANEWAPSPHQTIANWGCAETSAAMILQYYGITKLPDGTSLDPGSLNTWLKTHNGYVNGGWVYWPAIADLSHLAKLSGNDPNFAYDGLEYLPSDRNDTTLTQDLTNQEPDILEEPKHFVVATGKVNNTFSINDPYYTSTDLTQGYNNKYLAMKRFIPSHTDLSYLTIIADPTLTLTLTDINNVSTGSSYIQNPIADPEDPSITSGNPIKIFDVPKPNTGNYSLTISGQANQPYSVTVYFNDINGNIKDPVVLSGNLDNNGKSIAKIYFDKQSVSNDQIQTIVTFESFILDINHLQNQDQIQNGAGNAIAALAKNASKSVSKTNSFPAKVQLIALQGLLDVFHNRGISDEAYNILSFDVQYLLNSL